VLILRLAGKASNRRRPVNSTLGPTSRPHAPSTVAHPTRLRPGARGCTTLELRVRLSHRTCDGATRPGRCSGRCCVRTVPSYLAPTPSSTEYSVNWPDHGPTLNCPVCSGPIGFWVVRPSFCCHHCNARLSSNHRQVQWACFWGFLAMWAVATSALVLMANMGIASAATLSAQVLAPATLGLGWFALRYRVRLVQASNSGGA
jgi:hypothetical protein